jgi:predicted DNA binding CopG/RHH family protein
MTKAPSKTVKKRRKKQSDWISFDLSQRALDEVKEIALRRGVPYKRVIKELIEESVAEAS